MNVTSRGTHSRKRCAEYRKTVFTDILIAFISLCVLSSSSFALDPSKAISQYSHTSWQTDDGLPQIAVQSIYQTRNGYLWIGTQEGLARFDGVKFTVFDNTNTKGISHNSFQTLIQTSDGSIWAGTQSGLTCIAADSFKTYTKEDGLANDNVYSLYEDAQQNLWIGTGGGGLTVRKDGKFKTYTTKDGLVDNFVTSIVGGENGTIFIGTTGGLAKFSNGTFISYRTKNGLVDNTIRSLCYSARHGLWVGTVAGLCNLKDGKWTTFTTKDGLTNNRIRSILEDSDGNLWLGTEGGGMNRLRSGQISSYSSDDGLIDEYVWTFFEDHEKNLWVGTVGGGLHCFRDSKFTVFGEHEGLSQDNARSVFESRDGSVWIGADVLGLTHFKNGVVTIYPSPEAMTHYGVRGICDDQDGSLWIGTYGGGLCRLREGKWTTYTTKDGLANDRIFSLFMASDKTLWIGTRGGGISTLKNGKFHTYSTKDGLTNNEIRMILETSDGSIWICTSYGLNRYKNGHFTNYTTKDGLSYNIVYTIFEDENKTLWIGTYGGGLNRLKDGRFTAYTTKQGMYDNTVFKIIEDAYGYFWLTCNRGVYRVSVGELNDYADGKIQTVHCTTFGIADGLRSTKCNGSSQPAGIRTRDGRIWIPTTKGVAIVDPGKMKPYNFHLPIYIERVLYDSHPVPIDSMKRIQPGQGELEFQYTALSYEAPKLVKFKYMLIGFDMEWVEAGTRRIAYYTNIPPGTYTFKVIACTNDGIWNWDGAMLELNLIPHYYQTKWFRGFIAGLIIFLGFVLYRIRVVNLHRREHELVQIVEDRTKNLQQEIAERKRTEEELQILSSHYEAVLIAIPDIIMEVDNDKVYRWANRAGIKFFGEDVIGKHAESYSIDQQQSFDKIQSLFNGDENIIYIENWQRRRDGEKRLLGWWSHVLKDENGMIAGVLSTARDITEQKQAEEALFESEVKYREMVEQINDVLFTIDVHGVFQYISPASLFLTGYLPEEIIGHSVSEFLDPEYVPIVKQQIQKILSGTLEPFEYRIITKDGKFRWMRSSSKPILEKNKPVGLRGVLTDVTERKQAEETLNLFSHSIKSISECVSITDLNNTILFVNQAFIKTYGYQEQELIGKSIYMVRKGVLNNDDAVFTKTLQGGWQGELLNRKKDGTVFPVSLSTSVVSDENGQPVALVGIAVDITERKQAEETLQAIVKNYRLLFDQNLAGVFHTTFDGVILDCNDAFIKMLGYSSLEDLRVHRVTDLYFEKTERENLISYLQTHGFIKNSEVVLRRKDGTTLFGLENAALVKMEKDSDSSTILGTIIDITDRRDAEEALANERNLLRTLIDNMPDRIYAKDTESRFIICNRALAARMGFSNPEDIVGKTDFDLLPHDLAARFRSDELAIMQSGQSLINREEPMDSSAGTKRWNLATKVPLRDKQGNIVGVVGMGREITERKRAEEALQESEERYRRLVEFSPYMIIVHSEGKIVFVNPAAIKLFGAKEDADLIGRPFLDFIHPDNKESVRKRISRGMDDLAALPTAEEKFIRLDGEAVDVEETSLLVILNGKPAMQVVASNITERKKLRLELDQSQKMQSIGTLASGIAHDFNNILGIILGYVSLMEKRKADDPKNLESFSAINQSIQRGAALVRQILTFARKTDIVFELIDPVEVLTELLAMLRQTFPKVITFSEIVGENIPKIHADRTQIHQVLLNLCVNARDAMPNGGSITITIDTRTKEQLQERFLTADFDSYVCIKVADTGEGMDETTRLRVFDPFFTTKPKEKGTGLGLSVVYGAVKAHRGFVDLESKLGQGTTFEVFFPVPVESKRPAEVQQSLESFDVGGTETLLLVEDEEPLLELVSIMLEFKGYTVYTAKDGNAAIELYNQHKQEIAVVLTDLGLPGMTGMEELKRLKEISPKLKIIFSSGFFDPDMKSELFKAGAKGFIQKPYTTDEVLRVLRKVLDE